MVEKNSVTGFMFFPDTSFHADPMPIDLIENDHS
jgi:hypothetical protein